MKTTIVYDNIYERSILAISKKRIVLDIGGYSPFKGVDPVKSRLIDYKSWFDETRYFCLDILAEGKPHILGDAQNLPIKNESVDGIICCAVLEHIIEPQRAVHEIHRVLTKGGEAFFYLPFLYPYHAMPSFKDYHRFTEDIIIYMFRDFDEVIIQPGEGFARLALRFVTAFAYRDYLKFLAKPLEFFFRYTARHDQLKNTSGFHVFARK